MRLTLVVGRQEVQVPSLTFIVSSAGFLFVAAYLVEPLLVEFALLSMHLFFLLSFCSSESLSAWLHLYLTQD